VSKSPDEQAPGPGPGDADRVPLTRRGYKGPPGRPWPPPEPAVPPGKPRPGHGTVTVTDHDGEWMGVWNDSTERIAEADPIVRIEDFEGSKEEVLQWARSRPAVESFIFSRPANDYVPLSRDER